MTSSFKKRYLNFIFFLSFLIPVVVLFIIITPYKVSLNNKWAYALPHFNFFINFLTSLILLLSLFFIKNNKVIFHRNFMIIALFFSIVFLFFYVIYHISISETIYGDITNDGILIQEELIFIQYFRYLYLIILLSHILFSIIVIPIVLLSIFFIYINNINYHKKLVRYAWPIWFYVSVTGVIVYLMINSYY